jgi:FtsX-like permease family protein
MYSKLIINNWKARPGKFALMFSALCIALVLITLLSGLHAGLKDYFLNEGEKEKILRQLTVKPKGTSLELNLMNLVPSAKITPEKLETIKDLPKIQEVLPTNTVSGISSLQIKILNSWFQTDALLYGAPYELLDSKHVTADQWKQLEEPYPAVVSSQLIDLYNFAFANANSLPQVTEENFIGSEISILLNKSTFFATSTGEVKTLRAKIVGFSPNTKLIGLTLPLETIDHINQKYLNHNEKYYLDAIVRTKTPNDLSETQSQLEQLGFNVQTAETSLKTLESLFTLTGLTLNIFYAIMMILAGLLISSTFLAKITEKSKEIAILKTLGLTSSKISLMYLLEAAMVGLSASIGGIAIGYILSLPLEHVLSASITNLINKPEHFFLFTPNNLLFLTGFTILLSCAFAYWPAKKASKLDPVTILSK